MSSKPSLLKSIGSTLNIVFSGSVYIASHNQPSKFVSLMVTLSPIVLSNGSPKLSKNSDPKGSVDSHTDFPFPK
jgi:hypothetical protein